MDQLKQVFSAIKKYHFWILCGLIVLLYLESGSRRHPKCRKRPKAEYPRSRRLSPQAIRSLRSRTIRTPVPRK